VDPGHGLGTRTKGGPAVTQINSVTVVKLTLINALSSLPLPKVRTYLPVAALPRSPHQARVFSAQRIAPIPAEKRPSDPSRSHQPCRKIKV
jgi:hypothetical protein